MAETVQAVLTLGKNAVHGMRRIARGGRRRARPRNGSPGRRFRPRQGPGRDIEGFVRLHAEPPVDLAEGIRLLAPVVSAQARPAGAEREPPQADRAGVSQLQTATDHFPAAINRDTRASSPIAGGWRSCPSSSSSELYNQYNFDEPWDGPNNRKLIDKMPAIYAYPGLDGAPTSRSNPSYFVFTGESTLGGAEGGAKIQQITDGTSNTILAVEAKRDIPWTKPEDIPFDPKAPPPVWAASPRTASMPCSRDGSVRYIKKSINPIS